MQKTCDKGPTKQERTVRRRADGDTFFKFNFVNICTDLCITWATETGGKKRKGRIQTVLTDNDFPRAKLLARLQRVSAGYLKPEEGDAARLLTEK